MRNVSDMILWILWTLEEGFVWPGNELPRLSLSEWYYLYNLTPAIMFFWPKRKMRSRRHSVLHITPRCRWTLGDKNDLVCNWKNSKSDHMTTRIRIYLGPQTTQPLFTTFPLVSALVSPALVWYAKTTGAFVCSTFLSFCLLYSSGAGCFTREEFRRWYIRLRSHPKLTRQAEANWREASNSDGGSYPTAKSAGFLYWCI